MRRSAGSDHAVAMLHISVADSDPFQRGKVYGAALADRLPAVTASYLHLFAAWAKVPEPDVLRFGAATLDLLQRHRPHVAAEIEGVAAGGGLTPELAAALNARTEIVSAAECATVGRVRGPGGPWLAQNWDWFVDAPERCVVVSVEPGDGEHRYVTFTEAGILAKVGVNDAGLTLSLDILRHGSDHGRPTASPIHVLLREVLARCATVDDVAALLEDAEPSASSCMTVVTADGDGACFEVAPAGVARVRPDDDGLLHHTNHFLDPELATRERVVERYDRSCARHDLLVQRRPATIDDARTVLSDHDGELQPICRHDEPLHPGLPLGGTAAYIAMDPTARTMTVGAGATCQAQLETFSVPG